VAQRVAMCLENDRNTAANMFFRLSKLPCAATDMVVNF
jgi:hypothetical protein